MIEPADLLDFVYVSASEAKLRGGSEALARRTVSAAYYAVFHLLAHTGGSLFQASPEIQQRFARSYEHIGFSNAAQEVERRQTPPPDPDLVALAAIIRRLREARERADYDLTATVTWDDADELLLEVISAFSLVAQLRSTSQMADFLLSALIQKRRRG